MTFHPLALAALTLLALPAHALDCFGPGVDAMQKQRWHTAAAAFRDALDDPRCAAESDPLRYNLAVARHHIARSGDDPGGLAACEAEAIFRELIARSDDADLVTAARADIADARDRCAPPAFATAQVGPADRSLPWALTASAGTALAAGGLLIGLALDADAERADAKAAFINATTVIDQARAEALFEPARDRTTRYGLAAYATLGVGTGLGIAALLAWLNVNDPPAVQLAPDGAVIMQRF